jgi:hypothetical protein
MRHQERLRMQNIEAEKSRYAEGDKPKNRQIN